MPPHVEYETLGRLTRQRDNLGAYMYMVKAEKLAGLVDEWLMSSNDEVLERAKILAFELDSKAKGGKWLLPKSRYIVGKASFDNALINVGALHTQLKKTMVIDIVSIKEYQVDLGAACDAYMKVFEQSPYSKL